MLMLSYGQSLCSFCSQMLSGFLDTCICSPPLAVLHSSELLFIVFFVLFHYIWSSCSISFHPFFLAHSGPLIGFSAFSSLSLNNIMSSANLKLLSFTPLMFLLTLMFILLEISSSVAVNITGDNVSPWRTPFMILVFHLAFLLLSVLFLLCMFL